ncbi:hypothetical protein HOY82DRAFT_536098 [Tuber indicum]|nr:hypothetical protein HOY82DRAFT_536098 [Tuber indicum]
MSHQSVGGYKEEPATEPDTHPGHPQQHPPPPSSASTQHPQQQQQQHQSQHPRPSLPHQHSGQPTPSSTTFPSPHPPPHQSSFAQSPSLPGSQHSHPQDIAYYTHPSSPYGTPGGSGPSYPSQEGTDLMATHTMNRPQYPPIYHTPQSNSPSSVASPTAPDHRSVYTTQPMQTPMYGYPQQYPPIPAGPSSYSNQTQHHNLNNGPLLMSQTSGQTMTPPQPHHQHVAPNTSSTAKIAQTPLHRASPSTPSSGTKPGPGTASINPNAAPGPIPATTPLVVRQDNNGVQWIAFEYSRDRVKMEYTIRCDVESVTVDNLSHDFKTENCVYPRACCSKEQYRGNRLVYETECNTVGWALAELNPCLRGKRGLIQRAVDSWRNSNQDPRLRSRRVRRMAKINNRKANAQAAQTHLGAGSPHGVPSAGVGLGLKGPGLVPGSQPQLHHHHHPGTNDSPSAQNGEEEMGAMLHHHHTPQFGGVQGQIPSANTSRSTSGHLSPAVGGEEFSNGHANHHHHHQAPTSGSEIRPRHVFHGYPTAYPAENVGGASMPPSMHDGMDQMGPSSNTPTAVTASTPPNNTNTSLFGDIPDHKRRKFILVDDPHRGSRVRVRVMLDQVHMQEIPDSYRKSNSVYPRSYMASQMEDDSQTEVQTQVVVPMLDGTSMTIAPPPPSGPKRKKEMDLNELGYRMSWSQSRVFAGRTMFLQRALDAYRNKMRSSMMAAGTDVTSTAPHLETRAGKRRWLERNRRSKPSGSSS